uniref:Solute carrier family 35 member D3 n=1 Tax=Cyanistes caeruleus TaxID=156563 RepID=A0A8C0ZEU0_CYACU
QCLHKREKSIWFWLWDLEGERLGTSMKNPGCFGKCNDTYFLNIPLVQNRALFLCHVQHLCLFLSVTLVTGAGDLTGDAMGYVTGVLAVLIHAAYLVLIQKTSVDSEYGPLTAQYAIAVSATPFLIICSFASMDSINVWSFPGWKDPAMVCIFIACVLISCAMNFTTLHCTYINSAVTTSFVGVVKSIATITVGMVAFNDVEPTKLFILGNGKSRGACPAARSMRGINAIEILDSDTAVAYTLDCVWSLVILTCLGALSMCFFICNHTIIGTLHK